MPRRFRFVCFAIALAASGAVAQDCGDCNEDGRVDILDSLLASQHAAGVAIVMPSAERWCDVRGDETIDVLDALRIAQVSAGLTVALTCLPLPLPAPMETTEGSFVTSHVCATCHSNAVTATAMRDELQQPIGPFDLWQSTMMANSGRDPFWRAQVSAEIANTPARSTEIQQKCVRCHAPMASTEAALSGEPRPGLEILGMATPRGQLALDGVSCSLCHQIQPDMLGTPASYGGGFVIDSVFEIYGPHLNPLSFSMFALSGYTPIYSPHVQDSNLCGSCHTLFTNTLDPSGVETGDVMPEQTPYLEWRNSVYNDEVAMPSPMARTCQDCHAPLDSEQGVTVQTKIARTPAGTDYGIADRDPYGRHIFVGGNTLMPQIFRDNPVQLGVMAPPAAFDATIALARDQLNNRSAVLTVGTPARIVDSLVIPVQIQNLAGHKLPSAYPARRAWIRLEVTDGMGATVFLSGDYDSGGRLLDSLGAIRATELAGGPIEPHHMSISDPDEVQIYETIMMDTGGTPTWLLMRAAGYAKDNRILPRGWDPMHPDIADIAPAGVAGDGDYDAAAAAGTDNLVYELVAPAAAGPYTIQATLLYESISVRTINELYQTETSEIAAFRNYYQRADRTPEMLAQDTIVAP